MDCSTSGFPVHQQLTVFPNSCLSNQWCHPNILVLCCPLLLPSVFPSIRVFSDESALYIRWPKYWSFSFSISPCNEYSGLISFRIDWLDLLAVQVTEESSPAPQFRSISSLALHLFNALFRFIIAFLPRSKCLNFVVAVTICSDFEAQENSLSLFPLFPHLFAMKCWDWMPYHFLNDIILIHNNFLLLHQLMENRVVFTFGLLWIVWPWIFRKRSLGGHTFSLQINKNEIAGSYDQHMFNFLRYYHSLPKNHYVPNSYTLRF